MRLEFRCKCRHGYGTHRLVRVGNTVQPMGCRSPKCDCVLYEVGRVETKSVA